MTSKSKKVEEPSEGAAEEKPKEKEKKTPEKPKRTSRKKTAEKEAKKQEPKEETLKEPESIKEQPEIKQEQTSEATGDTPGEVTTVTAGEGKREEGGESSVEEAQAVWTPRTMLGDRVYKGEITSIKQVMELGIPIKEVGIVDKLLPGLKEEMVDVGRVQRVTDSGRRMRFRVVSVVGNEDGYVGLGEGKAREVGPAIRKAIDQAKMSLKGIKRGCGSWECGCGTPHTVPMKIKGKAGSVKVTIIPAPKGVGLVSGEVAKKILSLAGIKDAWVSTSGHTRTGINFAKAVFNALISTNYIKVGDKNTGKIRIIYGSKDDQ
ncbi:MAG: 30S ribosomal protein S5 [Candidatus Altiarchaeota archaeon]